MTLIDKFEKVLSQINVENRINVPLDFYEVSKILSSLKAQETYSKELSACLEKGMKKI